MSSDRAAYDLFRKEIGITRITDAVYTSGRINTEKYWDNRYTLKNLKANTELMKILGLDGMYDFSKETVNKRILKFLAGNKTHQAVLKSKVGATAEAEVEVEAESEAITPVAKEVVAKEVKQVKEVTVAKEVEVPATKTQALAKLKQQLAEAEAEAEIATMMARLRKLQAKKANVAVEDGSDAESEGYIAVA